MAGMLKLEIITPDGTLLSEQVESITLSGADGELTILPGHARLMTQLAPGEMLLCQGGQNRLLAVGQGLAFVKSDSVSIATDMAIPAENIDEAKAEEARQRAAAQLREKVSSEEVASVNASLARALAQLNVKRRSRK